MCNDVSSWEGPGVWNAGLHRQLGRPGGRGSASSARVCGLRKVPGCLSLRQAVAGMTRFPWAKEATTTSSCCPHSCVPQERDRGCWTESARCSHPALGPPLQLDSTSPAPSRLPLLCGGLLCSLVCPGPLSKAFWRHCPQTGSPNPLALWLAAHRAHCGALGPSAALPRSSLHCPGPLAHVLTPRHTESEAWLPSQSGDWFHFPCRSLAAHKGHTKDGAGPSRSGFPPPPRFGLQLGCLLLSTCSVQALYPCDVT